MQHLTILTGASRGMGLAIAQQLCAADALVLCISRGRADALDALALKRGATVTQWPADLADPAPVAARLRDWLGQVDAKQITSASLINNAGVVGSAGPLDKCDATTIAMALRVDLEAPMQLTAAFLAATAQWKALRKVLNVSSGLGRRPMAGAALYCAAKSGMDHFSRCVALEQEGQANRARIVSLAPGIIDTDMQTELRAGDPALFPERAAFVQMKESGSLSTPADAARRLLAYLARADFGTKAVADVRDA